MSPLFNRIIQNVSQIQINILRLHFATRYSRWISWIILKQVKNVLKKIETQNKETFYFIFYCKNILGKRKILFSYQLHWLFSLSSYTVTVALCMLLGIYSLTVLLFHFLFFFEHSKPIFFERTYFWVPVRQNMICVSYFWSLLSSIGLTPPFDSLPYGEFLSLSDSIVMLPFFELINPSPFFYQLKCGRWV